MGTPKHRELSLPLILSIVVGLISLIMVFVFALKSSPENYVFPAGLLIFLTLLLWATFSKREEKHRGGK